METALFVENLPRACPFYEQVLDLMKIKASDKGCVFHVASQRYLLLVPREGARTPNETPNGIVLPPCALPQHDGRGPGHIAFGVSSAALDSWRARLDESNYPMLRGTIRDRNAVAGLAFSLDIAHHYIM